MLAYGFMSSHVSKEDVEVMLAQEASHGHGSAAHATDAHHSDDADAHAVDHTEHVMHQIHNRPWAALYIGAFFFIDLPRCCQQQKNQDSNMFFMNFSRNQHKQVLC